jgi:hypothetical protein
MKDKGAILLEGRDGDDSNTKLRCRTILLSHGSYA